MLARVHRADILPWTLSSHPNGRFNLDPPQGTCYLAEEPIATFLEVFTRLGSTVDRRSLSKYRLSWFRLDGEWRLADLTARAARGAGITAGIHSSRDYDLTRSWAAAIAVGFEGIRYRPRNDPSTSLTSIALFSTEAGRSLSVVSTAGLPPGLLQQAETEFGVRVVPRAFNRRA